MLLNPREIPAFKCPKCKKLIEMEPESKLYVKIEGSLNLGEEKEFVRKSDTPGRICIPCLIQLLNEASREFDVPVFRNKHDESGSEFNPFIPSDEFPGQKPSGVTYKSNTAGLGRGYSRPEFQDMKNLEKQKREQEESDHTGARLNLNEF